MNEDPSYLSPEDLDKAQRIAYLVGRYIQKRLTTKERDELDRWVAESDHNVLLFEEMTDERYLADMRRELAEINTAESLERIKKRIVFTDPPKKPLTRKILPYAVAASVLGIIITTMLLNRTRQRISGMPAAKILNSQIVPGSNKATLTLANGSTIDLNGIQNGVIAVQGEIKIYKNDSGQLSYSKPREEIQEEAFNSLMTPRGGQFRLLLPDGTHIWLNAQSSIRYPVDFSKKERIVELKGEGYFEVAKDAMHPFHVKVGTADIVVLGTHFNINAYNDEKEIKTTLVEGSVKIIIQQNSMLLRPGEQLQWSTEGRMEKLINVDTSDITGWRDGIFSFHHEEILEVMKQVARWYDVDYKYNLPVQSHFNATFERNVPVSQLLKLLEETGGVHFIIKDRTIIVNP
jgi:transmembrane sensor